MCGAVVLARRDSLAQDLDLPPPARASSALGRLAAALRPHRQTKVDGEAMRSKVKSPHKAKRNFKPAGSLVENVEKSPFTDAGKKWIEVELPTDDDLYLIVTVNPVGKTKSH